MCVKHYIITIHNMQLKHMRNMHKSHKKVELHIINNR